ncbi:hypothetical protein OH77DRAFT_510937 [Trametes cingulata]|nr:hypothetical protein OH77DRAFT_510937 [Trametes cingulata]
MFDETRGATCPIRGFCSISSWVLRKGSWQGTHAAASLSQTLRDIRSRPVFPRHCSCLSTPQSVSPAIRASLTLHGQGSGGPSSCIRGDASPSRLMCGAHNSAVRIRSVRRLPRAHQHRRSAAAPRPPYCRAASATARLRGCSDIASEKCQRDVMLSPASGCLRLPAHDGTWERRPEHPSIAARRLDGKCIPPHWSLRAGIGHAWTGRGNA